MTSPAPALPLFVYGTLRDPDLLAAVLNRPLHPGALLPARAPGFRAVPYPSRLYPALIRSPGATAEGLLLTDLSPFERDLLDAFEGDEYLRGPIAAIIEPSMQPGTRKRSLPLPWRLLPTSPRSLPERPASIA